MKNKIYLNICRRAMIRKFIHIKLCGRRKKLVLLLPLLAMTMLWYPDAWLSLVSTNKSQPSEEENLQHFRRTRSLEHYMDNTQLLIQPLTKLCSNTEEVPVVILVSSAPDHFKERQAVRKTWSKFQPTYFVMGLSVSDVAKQLETNREESDLYGDMIIYDFRDHYQNSTLKTALMMYWTIGHCMQAQFMLKTDDDALVNPWTLNEILKEMHSSNVITGHKYTDRQVDRDEFHRRYMPPWLYQLDIVPQYLDESGYLISGKDVVKIFHKAYDIPLINLEDIFFTYLVAVQSLGLNLRHERRLCPKRPWLNLACAYWCRAVTHGYPPDEMVSAWSMIENLAIKNNTGCGFINLLVEYDLFLY